MSLPKKFVRATKELYKIFTHDDDPFEFRKGDAGEPPQGKTGVIPHSFDYPHGYNITTTPRSGMVSFKTLREVAENCELVRIAVQNRKSQIRGLDWDITVKPRYKALDPTALETRAEKIRNFFMWPDPLNDLNFHDWLAAWMEDQLVIDVGALYFLRDRASRLKGLLHVDGATIKPILDDKGFVPEPPRPAYAQVLGDEVKKFTRKEMLYCVYNIRPNSAYGMSPVEMVLMAAHISLKRELYGLSYYTEGSVPEQLIIAPENWTPEQIGNFERVLNDYLTGNLARRHHIKILPYGSSPKETKSPDFLTQVQVDEWLSRIIHAAFENAPHLLLRQRTKQQAAAMESQQTQTGLDPLKKYIAETLTTRVIEQEFKEPGLQFTWLSDKKENQQLAFQKARTLIPVGALGLDEVRESIGQPKLGIPPYIQMPNGIVLLTPQLLEAIKSGKVNLINQDGAMDVLAPPAPKPSGESPGSEHEPSGATKADMLKELRKWKRAALTDLRAERPIRKFKCDYISESIARGITERLGKCSSVDEVRGVFGLAIEELKNERAGPGR